jgi:phosphoglycerol transferase MdoB-like AlkP superfamily enzyme
LSETEIRELSSRNMENYDFERFHMPFIIYNEGQDTIEINKLGSSLDILPTILNLFGIEYDSRLLMGKDILSDFEPLIIFSNRSFITTEGKYNSNAYETSDKEEVLEMIKEDYNKIFFE